MLLERELGLSESYSCFCHDEAAGTTNLVGYLSASGDLDKNKILNSLNGLIKKHHTLRSQIEKHPKKHKIKIHPEIQHLPFNYTETKNCHWQEVIEKHQSTLFDNSEYNWRLEVIKEDNNFHIFICFHHAISDGKSTAIFLSELLEGCEGEQEIASERHLLPAIETLLQRKISWLGFIFKMLTSSRKYIVLNKHIQKYENKAELEHRTAKNKHLTISSDKLNRLITKCKNEGTSLTALLTAILLKSIESLELGSDKDIKRHLIFTNIDVRNKCQPQIPKDQLGCFVDLAETQEIIKPELTIWEIAKNYRKNLLRALDKPGKLPQTFNQGVFHKMLRSFDQGFLQHKFHYGAGVTNIGKIDYFSNLKSISLNRFHFATSRVWGDWMILLHIATVNEQAFLSFSYADPLLSNASADKLIHNFSRSVDTLLSDSDI